VNALDSEAAVRSYVEGELQSSIGAKRPELRVKFTGECDGRLSGPKGMCWKISLPRTPGSWPSDYMLEARLEDRESIIWFGYSSAGAWGTHHIMRPAVHVRFQDLGFAAQEFPEGVREFFTLGEILSEMVLRARPYPPNVLPSHDSSLLSGGAPGGAAETSA